MTSFDSLYIAAGNAGSEKAIQLLGMLKELPRRVRVVDVLKESTNVPPFVNGVPMYVCARSKEVHRGSACYEAMIDEDAWLEERGGEVEEDGPRGLDYMKNSNLYDRSFVAGMGRSSLDSSKDPEAYMKAREQALVEAYRTQPEPKKGAKPLV